MWSTVFLYANDETIHQFKAKDSEIKSYTLCFGNISKDFTVNNMKKTEFNRKVYKNFVSHETINVTDIEDIHKYLMKKHSITIYSLLFIHRSYGQVR